MWLYIGIKIFYMNTLEIKLNPLIIHVVTQSAYNGVLFKKKLIFFLAVSIFLMPCLSKSTQNEI